MQALGVVLFLLIGGMAFWMLLFLLGFAVPFWATLGLFETLKSRKLSDDDDDNEE
jgi:cytochrome c biogenesis protein CcdA